MKGSVIMITQQQNKETLPEEQAQSTVEEPKTPQSVQKSAFKITSKAKMLLIGSCVLFLAGAIFSPLSYAVMGNDVTNMWLCVSIGTLFALIGAFVFSLMARSFWTLLYFPVAILVGLLVGALLMPNYFGVLLPAWAFNFYILFFPITAFIGSAIGTLTGKELKDHKFMSVTYPRN